MESHVISTLIIFQGLGTLVQTNENDIQSISANLTVRKVENYFVILVST